MKRTHLIATIVGLMAIAVASQDALARGRMYHPGLGVFMQRDPVGTATAPPMARNLSASQYTRRDPTVQYADGMNLYQYVRSNPANRRDWTGLGSECYCGPDVTGFLVDLVNYAGKWRVKQGAISRPQGIAWLQANGVNLDWWSRTYKIKSCPSKGKPCKNTYWLCGECVHDHWIGNFMYGYLGRLLSLPDWMMDAAGDYVQSPGAGDDPTLDYSDPPWDTAGYGLARIMYDELTNPKGKQEVCDILKSNMGLWNAANNTTARPTPSSVDIGVWIIYTTPNWPFPHALGYKKCKKCPEDLPAAVRNTVPGGTFGKSFPNVK